MRTLRQRKTVSYQTPDVLKEVLSESEEDRIISEEDLSDEEEYKHAESSSDDEEMSVADSLESQPSEPLEPESDDDDVNHKKSNTKRPMKSGIASITILDEVEVVISGEAWATAPTQPNPIQPVSQLTEELMEEVPSSLNCPDISPETITEEEFKLFQDYTKSAVLCLLKVPNERVLFT